MSMYKIRFFPLWKTLHLMVLRSKLRHGSATQGVEKSKRKKRNMSY